MLSTLLKFKFFRNNARALFLCLAIAAAGFVFLFGDFHGAFAAQKCNDIASGGVAATWQTAEFACDVNFKDMGGSNLTLTSCGYRIKSNDAPTFPSTNPADWEPVPVPDTYCNGTSPPAYTIPSTSFTVGSGKTCRDEGSIKCKLYLQATDNSNNTYTNAASPESFNIDFTKPVTNISCNGGSCAGWHTSDVTITLYTNTLNGSSDNIYECHDTSNSCAPHKATNNTAASSISYSFVLSAEGTTYVRYYAQDIAGNIEIGPAHSVAIQIDKNRPTISSFSADPVAPQWTQYNSYLKTFSWTVSDLGGSHLKQIEIWRAPYDGTNCKLGTEGTCNWSNVKTVADPTSSDDGPWSSNDMTSSNESVYWYGIHAVDGADNYTTETQAGFSVQKIQTDKTNPLASVTSPASGPSQLPPKFNATFSFSDPTTSDSTILDKSAAVSGLAWCGYSVQSYNGVSWVETVPFTLLTPCSGAGPLTFNQTITVGKSKDCRDGGTGACAVGVSGADNAGNPALNWSYFTISSLNQAPSISTVTDSPDPIAANSQITFSANWSDPDGDPVQFFACKNSATPSGGNCSGGDANTWCKTPSTSSANPALCGYTAQTADVGTKQYYAFVCDTGNACSTFLSGTFTVFLNHPPTLSNLSDDHFTANYCSTTGFVIPPPITLSWVFHDTDAGDHESFYQAQIDTSSSFNSQQGNPLIDSKKVAPGGTITDGTSQSYAPIGLSYAKTYYWRVQVWDNSNVSSGWSVVSSFATPSHYYPIPNFIWSPASPSAKEQVLFSDQTNFYNPVSQSNSWLWNFGDAFSSTLQNPTHAYGANGPYNVSLQAKDSAGSCITNPKPINIGIPFPQWQEISPF